MGTEGKFERLAEVCRTGDIDAIADLVVDDVEWWLVGASEPIRGRTNLLAQEADDLSRWSIDPSFHDVLVSNDHLVGLVEATAKRGDDIFTYRTVEIFHVNDEGKITHRWSFADDTQAVRDFFS